MLDQNTFTETIRAVQDIIRTSAEPIEKRKFPVALPALK